MKQFSVLVDAQNPSALARGHDNLGALSEQDIHQLLDSALGSASDDIALYLDDSDVRTIDRATNSEHDHVNRKEVASGDVALWTAVSDGNCGGERIEQVEAQYGIYCGSKGGELFYDTVEVEIIPK